MDSDRVPPRPPGQWPAGGLEAVERCPVCSEEARSLLYMDLWDSTFFVAPGRWSMWRCARCGSGYLDPRPTPEAIGIAYGRYYTHEEPKGGPGTQQALTLFQTVRLSLGNGFRNARYGTELQPSLYLGRFVASVVPAFRRPVDLGYRYLPKRPPGRRPRVLDIGCGSGEWLSVARLAGWEAVGADPDPIAVSQGRAKAFDVRDGGAEAWQDQPGSFDAVTLSHVIEHVHDPLKTLSTAFDLLRPGGQLFIETPNMEAFGHEVFGRDWRGLEPPRHLVLFTRSSLTAALTAAGYRKLRYRRRPSPAAWITMQSARIAAGLDPYGGRLGHPVRRPSLQHRLTSSFSRTRGEFLTLTCEKPQ